jgi:hypothetical protein
MSRHRRDGDYETLRESRLAAIHSAANMLEGLAEAKKFRRRFDATRDESANGSDEVGSGDFLFDLLRLNATYLNELSQLGRSYGNLATRALQNLYELAKPGMSNHCADELVFHLADQRESRKRRFVVQNDVNPDITHVNVIVPRNQIAATGEYENGLHVEEPDASALDYIEAGGELVYTVEPLLFGIPKVLALHVKEEAFLKRRYELYALIELELPDGRKRRRRIPVIVYGGSVAP